MSVPPLPGRPSAATRRTWDAWHSHPVAGTWTQADRDFAERLIQLVTQLHREPTNLRLAHEVRQGERRLRLSHAPSKKPPIQRPARSRQPPSPKLTPLEELAPLLA